jgi:hypothetical protein
MATIVAQQLTAGCVQPSRRHDLGGVAKKPRLLKKKNAALSANRS